MRIQHTHNFEMQELLAGLTFVRPRQGRIYIAAPALNIISSYIQYDTYDLEAGGVLLGRHIIETDDMIVDQVTVPMLGDRRSRFRFKRSRASHQAYIDRAWSESKGTCTYLGEWHTHPENIPNPSAIDRLDWHRKLIVDRYSDLLFFFIAGTKQIRGWEGRPWGRITALTSSVPK